MDISSSSQKKNSSMPRAPTPYLCFHAAIHPFVQGVLVVRVDIIVCHMYILAIPFIVWIITNHHLAYRRSRNPTETARMRDCDHLTVSDVAALTTCASKGLPPPRPVSSWLGGAELVCCGGENGVVNTGEGASGVGNVGGGGASGIVVNTGGGCSGANVCCGGCGGDGVGTTTTAAVVDRLMVLVSSSAPLPFPFPLPHRS